MWDVVSSSNSALLLKLFLKIDLFVLYFILKCLHLCLLSTIMKQGSALTSLWGEKFEHVQSPVKWLLIQICKELPFPLQDEWNNSELLLGQFYITFFVEYVRTSANTVYLISCVMNWSEENKKTKCLTWYCTENWISVTGWGSRVEKITKQVMHMGMEVKTLGFWQNMNFWLTCKDHAPEASRVCPFFTRCHAGTCSQSQQLVGGTLVVTVFFLNRLWDISDCITQVLLSYTLWRQKHIEIQEQKETQSHKSLQSTFPFPSVNFINLDIVNNICDIWKVKLVQ